jgi:hypothetical protein
MSKKILAILVFLSCFSSVLVFGGQDDKTRPPFANQFYLFAGSANFSLATDYLPPGVDGTCSTLALGLGATLGSPTGRFFYELEIEYAHATYPGEVPTDSPEWSDWQGSVTYLQLFLNVGVVPAFEIPLGFYVTFGGAWQSNETYPLILGLGLKFSPVRFLALRGDFKFFLNEEQHWRDIGEGWYEQQPSTFSFGGTKLTGSIEIRFDFRSSGK